MIKEWKEVKFLDFLKWKLVQSVSWSEMSREVVLEYSMQSLFRLISGFRKLRI